MADMRSKPYTTKRHYSFQLFYSTFKRFFLEEMNNKNSNEKKLWEINNKNVILTYTCI